MNELDPVKLKAELDQFRKEKEKIRKLMGQIGGKHEARQNGWINAFFIFAILLIAINDVLHHFTDIKGPLTTEISLGIGVLLVSVKIIWMMHMAARVAHFQFWILNAIEFRLSDVSLQLRKLEETVEKYHAVIKNHETPE